MLSFTWIYISGVLWQQQVYVDLNLYILYIWRRCIAMRVLLSWGQPGKTSPVHASAPVDSQRKPAVLWLHNYQVHVYLFCSDGSGPRSASLPDLESTALSVRMCWSESWCMFVIAVKHQPPEALYIDVVSCALTQLVKMLKLIFYVFSLTNCLSILEWYDVQFYKTILLIQMIKFRWYH